MRKPIKTDFRIEKMSEDCYMISKKYKFLFILYVWITLTYFTEDSIELPLEFKSLKEAEDFIWDICD